MRLWSTVSGPCAGRGELQRRHSATCRDGGRVRPIAWLGRGSSGRPTASAIGTRSDAGDGAIVEFRSVVDAVNCAIEVQRAMVERNAEVAPDKRIEFRIGIHLGDVVEESDGDLKGDGVNIAARRESVAKPGAICLSEDAYRQVSGRLDMEVTDLGPTQLKNIERPIRVYSLQVGVPPKRDR